MRTFVLAMVALLVTSLEASAVPAKGADPVINARKQQADAKKKCFGPQRRDRYGYCIPDYRR